MKCCGTSCYGSSNSLYTTETLHYCYLKTCPANYGTESRGELCSRNTKNKRSHTAVCDSYSKCNQGGGCNTASTGGCFVQCSPGDKEFTGLCFPEAVLKISIQGIFDAFASILDFISGLPLGKYIKMYDVLTQQETYLTSSLLFFSVSLFAH